MSIEIYSPIENASKLQALFMAEYAGIHITSEQISWYVQCRLGILNNKLSKEEPMPFNLSDQQLLHRGLDREQKRIFELHYPNITFQSDNMSEAETASVDYNPKARI